MPSVVLFAFVRAVVVIKIPRFLVFFVGICFVRAVFGMGGMWGRG